jgi:hypothetical protein
VGGLTALFRKCGKKKRREEKGDQEEEEEGKDK